MTGILDNTVAIVTGGGRGIGRAVALALGRAGAAVSVAARSESELAETAALLREANGRVVTIGADVTDARAVHRLVEETERQLGPIDVLVNNAGTAYALGPVWEVDPDVWWRDVEVSLRGSFLCSRAVLPGMLARQRGRIINMASGIGLRPSPFGSAYACAKAALLRLTDSVASSTRDRGISVFAISPGNVQTAMMDYLTESEAGRRWLGGRRRAEFQPPERVAGLCVTLAAGHADRLSGRYIHVTHDLGTLIENADLIEQDDLYALRLRTLPPGP